MLGIAKAKAASYRTPADLKGQKIGITGPGSATETFLNLVLHQGGLKPSDVTPVTVGAAAVAVAAMRRSNELYAISNLDPAITELSTAGDIIVVADSRTAGGTRTIYGGDYASGSLYANTAFVQKNPRTAQAIATAMVRTLAWLKAATPEQIMAALPAEFYQIEPRPLPPLARQQPRELLARRPDAGGRAGRGVAGDRALRPGARRRQGRHPGDLSEYIRGTCGPRR